MIIYFLILLGAVLRVVPHPGNFAPIAAIALFGAVYIKDRRLALIVPLAAMIISDIFIGFDSLQSRMIIYGLFLTIGLMGLMIRERKNVFTVVGGSIFGSTIFFLISNLVWLYPPVMYAHTWQAQMLSYTNALPFFRYTLIGDLFYVGLFFGIYEAVRYFQYDYKSSRADSRA